MLMLHSAPTANQKYAQQTCLFMFLVLHLKGTNIMLQSRLSPGICHRKEERQKRASRLNIKEDGILTYLNDVWKQIKCDAEYFDRKESFSVH